MDAPGAAGVVGKTVEAGERAGERASERVSHPLLLPPQPTPREMDILRCLIDGLTLRETAAHLGITIQTVKNHRVKLYIRLGVSKLAQAVRVAYKYGLVPMP